MPYIVVATKFIKKFMDFYDIMDIEEFIYVQKRKPI